MKKVEVTIDIHAKPGTIISAFTDPESLKGWWGVERTLIDKRPGGVYTLAWQISDKGFGFISTGVIREYVSDSLLIIDNFVYLNPEKSFLGPMTLTIKAKRKGDVSEFYLCQDGYQSGKDWDWYYEAVKEAWPIAAQALKKYLETEVGLV
jgi:uncharacterized protein YndB with AHSA1/START domain